MARLRGERCGPAEYGVEEPRLGQHRLHHPQVIGLAGFDHFAAEDQAGRSGQADQPGQPLGAASAGDGAVGHFDETEGGRW
jgi:hypothetical protein